MGYFHLKSLQCFGIKLFWKSVPYIIIVLSASVNEASNFLVRTFTVYLLFIYLGLPEICSYLVQVVRLIFQAPPTFFSSCRKPLLLRMFEFFFLGSCLYCLAQDLYHYLVIILFMLWVFCFPLSWLKFSFKFKINIQVMCFIMPSSYVCHNTLFLLISFTIALSHVLPLFSSSLFFLFSDACIPHYCFPSPFSSFFCFSGFVSYKHTYRYLF